MIFYVERERYLGLRVGLMAQPKDALTEAEMLTLAGVGSLPGLYPESSADLSGALDALAERLRLFGVRVLAGDPAVFDDARALRRTHTERFMAPREDR